jgi:hypothetical protein
MNCSQKKIVRSSNKEITMARYIGTMEADAAKKAAKKATAKKAAAKKADPMKTSAKSHQKDLAKMSGETAAMKKFKADKKAGIRSAENKPSRAYTAGKKAEKRTLKSFK